MERCRARDWLRPFHRLSQHDHEREPVHVALVIRLLAEDAIAVRVFVLRAEEITAARLLDPLVLEEDRR